MQKPIITCPHKPETQNGGMYHCPICGMMVIAGIKHLADDGCVSFDDNGNLLISGVIDETWNEKLKSLKSEANNE